MSDRLRKLLGLVFWIGLSLLLLPLFVVLLLVLLLATLVAGLVLLWMLLTAWLFDIRQFYPGCFNKEHEPL